jgi:PAS domain S-box-containing protein
MPNGVIQPQAATDRVGPARVSPVDFRAVFEGLPGLYLVLAPDLTIVAVSAAYAHATMTVAGEILGRGIFDVFPDNPDDPAADGVGNLRASLMRVLAVRRSDPMAVQKYDIARPEAEGGGFEERYWSPVNTPILDDGGEVAWIVHRVEDVTALVAGQTGNATRDQLARDQQAVIDRLRTANRALDREIEERRAAQQELSQARQFLSLVIENIPGMVFAKDAAELRFILMNRGGEQLLGFDRSELIGKTDYDFLPREQADAYVARDRAVLAAGALEITPEEAVTNRAGMIRHLRTKKMPVFGDDGQPEFLLCLSEDITERRNLERQLQQARKLEAIGRLTGGIAHDFNNLLGIVTGNLDLLLDRLEGDPDAMELARDALDGALRGAELTKRMLAFGRQQPLQPTVIDLNEIVLGMTNLLRRALREDIVITTAPADGLWPALCDKSQVENAILNLAINARDAMPGGGRLLLETANIRLDEDYASRNTEVAPGDYVMLAVTDSGTGMPPDVIERAFEPFFTTKPAGEGNGLGLSMIYGFVKQSEGHIKIYSEVGHGTTIRLYVPTAGADAARDGQGQTADTPAARRETILVVEDDERLRRMAVKLLGSLGYQVREAGSARAALEILNSGESIDLLFSDVVMPGGMLGSDLAAEVKITQPRMKVLLTTGYSEVFVKEGGGPLDDVAMIGKPYRKPELAAKLRELLDHKD